MSHGVRPITIAYLTGTASINSNGIFADDIDPHVKSHLALDQMFFKPYESEKEFIFCVRHTLRPMLTAGFFLLFPITAFLLNASIVCVGLTALSIGALIKDTFAEKTNSSFMMRLSEICFNIVCQNIVDSLLLPLTVITMVTRSISTGLEDAGMYDVPNDGFVRVPFVVLEPDTVNTVSSPKVNNEVRKSADQEHVQDLERISPTSPI